MTRQTEPRRPPEREEETHASRRRRILRVVGLVSLVGLIAGGGFAWYWIRYSLVPFLESQLAELLNRPVELGEVQQVGFGGIQFGESAVPATPTDPDRVATENVVVEFDLLPILLRRTLQLRVILEEPDAYIAQSEDGLWVSTEIKSEDESSGGLLTVELQEIQLRNADLALNPQPRPNVPEGLVRLSEIDGAVEFRDDNELIRYALEGNAVEGGNVRVTGETRRAEDITELTVRGDDLLAVNISRLIDLPVAFQAGRVDGNVTVLIPPDDGELEIDGTASFDSAAAQIAELPQRFTETNGRLRFLGNVIAFDSLRTRYGEIPSEVDGEINLETGYDLLIETREPVAIAAVLDTLDVSAPVPLEGELVAEVAVEGPLQEPVLIGTVNTVNAATVDQVAFQDITAQFRFSTVGDASTINLLDLQAIPQAGGRIVASGDIQLGDTPELGLTVQAVNVPGDAIAQSYGVSPGDIRIGEVSAIARIAGTTDDLTTLVQFQLPNATYPGQGDLLIGSEGNLALQNAAFSVAGGRVELTGRVVDGQLQAAIDASQVGLAQFSEDLRGELTGTLQVSGPTENLGLSTLNAAGQLSFSQGIALVEEPLTTQIQWTGDQLIIEQATAPGLLAQGTIDVQAEGPEAPAINAFNLDVQAQDYALQDLGLGLPGDIALLGQADFDGRVTGTPAAPNAVGALRVEGLQVGSLDFAPVMTGRVDYRADQQTQLQLSGGQDQIALALGPNNRPQSFLVRQDTAIAQGTTQGDTLLVDLQSVPLTLVESFLPQDNLAVAAASGELFGELAVNLDTFAVRGDVAIAEPSFRGITAQQVQVGFQFADGILTIDEGVIQQEEGRIALAGTIPIGQAQPVDFEVTLDEARVQTLIQAATAFQGGGKVGIQPPPLGDAADLGVVAIDVSEQSLLGKLQRLAEVQRTLALLEPDEPENDPLPPLTALEGTVNGTIAFSGVLEEGLDARFDLLGQNWVWGDYTTIETVVAEGRFQDGVLTAQPIQLDVGEGMLAFVGQFGEEQLSGQLRAGDLPLELLEPFLANAPVDLDGRLDAIAEFSGSLDNPTADGTVVLEAARLNEQPIERAAAQFEYTNAILDFNSTILVAEANPNAREPLPPEAAPLDPPPTDLENTEPVTVIGTVPLALPFAEVQPPTEQINIQAAVEDEGLAIANLFTDQVRWVEGDGALNIAITGTLEQPELDGTLVVEGAVLETEVLNDPLTDVTGTVLVEGNRLQVEALTADYNEGELVAAGNIPISRQQATVGNPLEVALTDLTVNIANELYEGGVSGDVVLTGALLEPTVGGTLRLTNGELALGNRGSSEEEELEREEDAEDPDLIPDDIEDGDENPLDPNILEEDVGIGAAAAYRDEPFLPGVPSDLPPTEEETTAAIAFNDLQLILEDDVQVTSDPLLSFEVAGDLTLNGTLDDPRPEGAIELTSGQINLFTTRFLLDRGYDQTVIFTPKGGIDPILDIQLYALVPETTGGFISQEATATGEIIETPDYFGNVRTVRVEARVVGPASELSENIELTSDPDRTESEIVSLLGGSILTTFGENPALGAATFAGSALFGSDLQAVITELQQAVGLSELRIYPTFVPEEEESDENSVLGLSVEGIVDVSEDFSVSVAGVVGSEDPVRYGVIYRISDEFLLRTSTDLAGDNRATLRYEITF